MKYAWSLIALLLVPVTAWSQDEEPALPDDVPAVSTEMPEPAPAPGTVTPPAGGTTVIGEQEAPIGLYIMPWRQSSAERGLDRPARLLDEALLPLDPEVFRRQVEYHRALTDHLRQTGRATP